MPSGEAEQSARAGRASGNADPIRAPAHFEAEFPSASRSATEAGVNLARTANLFLAEMDRRRHTVANLSASASQILTTIEGAGEPLAPHIIADRLLVTTGTMTMLLDTLQRRGLIRRIPHPGDRRKLLIDLTDAGRTVVDALLPRMHAGNRDIFSTLSEADREAFIQSLGRVRAHLEELRARDVAVGQELRVKEAVPTPSMP